MRPVHRGPRPTDYSEHEIQFGKYQEARSPLIQRFGQYCSYCEVKLSASLAVEHVQPKTKHPDQELEWENFLLACVNCNSTKSDKDVELSDYFWPDEDNTFRAFDYAEGGTIKPAEGLDGHLKVKATATIQLTGLDKQPANDPKASDRRWLNRKESWEIAQRAKERLFRNNNDDFREQIKENALSQGFWSIWMTVYEDDPDMRKRLIEAFPGTAQDCFDENSTPFLRPGGQI
jgi:uncharacterized protein (TIGR02646 family)